MIPTSKKRLGQHFLTSPKIAGRIAKEAAITVDDVILEIGSGKGILTDAIFAYNPKKIIAVEKDAKLIPFLKEKYNTQRAVTIIHGDIRFLLKEKAFMRVLGASFKVVANIPYYLTSYLFRLTLEQNETLPLHIVLMVQKEVAQRIVARPPHMNLLALAVQSMGKARIAFTVPKSFFRPQPKVDSAVIVIENISNHFFRLLHTEDARTTDANVTRTNVSIKKEFFALLHAGFRQKRKRLINNIAGFIKKDRKELENIFKTCGIPLNARAENLSLEEWKCLYLRIRNYEA